MCVECRRNPCVPTCPNRNSYLIGTCDWCKLDIYDYYERWTDDEENLFCCKKCAEEFHGIREVDT